MTTTNETMVSIFTPFNQRRSRMTPDNRRVFRDGRWQRVGDAKARTVLQWLKGESK